MRERMMPTTDLTDATVANKDIKPGWRKFLFTEIATSAVANTLFSIAFVTLAFQGHAQIPISGSGGLIRDAIPQSFMVALMGTLISPLITRNRIAKGSLPIILSNKLQHTYQVYVRAFLFAFAAMIVGVAAQAVLLPVLFPPSLGFWYVFLYKSLYGAGLAILITPCALLTTFKYEGSRD